jgi:hypothetical protein
MNKEKLYKDFYNAIKKSYLNYLLFGDRSEEKLKPLHTWIGNTIQSFINKEYNVYFLNGKEVQTEGAYYTKIIDIAIVKKEIKPTPKKIGVKTVFYIPNIKMGISIKFITSNFKQNANNYFENLLGECANLKAKKIIFAHFVVFRDKIPYFERNGELKHWEILEDRDINKYIRLFKERGFPHAPDIIGIEIINIHPIVEEIYKKKPKFSEEEIKSVISKNELKIQNGIDNTNINEEVKEFVFNNFILPYFLEKIKRLFS